jgi:cell division protein FtsZ
MNGAIRVSVVATGIDASAASRADAPVARRSMAAPLPPVAQPAPYAAAEARPEPRMSLRSEPRAPVEEEPNLFQTMDEEPTEEFFDETDEDDVPPPAYRPQPEPARAAAAPRAAAAMEDDLTSFIAPRARPIGTPSPEALARLQAAASKAPLRAPNATPAPARAAAPVRAAEKPRFGIGSLINRMSGNSESATAAPARQQPPVSGYDDDAELNADEERIEIPAFLRRQAN